MQDRFSELKNWFSTLESAQQHLFAVVDAAREPRIPAELRGRAVEFVSLYRGEPEEALVAVAPYLVQLDLKSEFTRWLLADGWGNSWGIFLVSQSSLEDLRRHLRHFLLVRDPAGTELYFRFYDPRVLRVYLPTCTAAETKRFFGPVATYLMETEDGHGVMLFSRQGSRTIRLADLSSNTPSGVIEHDDVIEKGPKPNVSRMKIRYEQMQALNDYMNTSFLKRAAVHLRQEHPRQTNSMSDTDLHRLVNAGSDRAAAYGLMRENEIVSFLELLILFGEDFDTRTKWAPPILHNPDLSPPEKVEALQEHRDTVQSIGENA
jgi:hypothetical protein